MKGVWSGVEEKRAGGEGGEEGERGAEVLRWLIAPLENMVVAVGEFNSLMILMYCLKSSTEPPRERSAKVPQ